MKIKHFVSFALLFPILGSLPSCFFYGQKKKGPTFESVSRIVEVAKKNNKNISIDSLLNSLKYKGDESFTNERMMLLLKRAFPSLEDPSPYYVGFNTLGGASIAPLSNWTELSESTQDAIDYFQRRSLYFPKKSYSYEENVNRYFFYPDDIAKREDLEIMLRRIQGYIGLNPEDDFYSYTNHEELFSSNKEYKSNFIDKNIINENVKSFVGKLNPDDQNKRRIGNFMKSFIDDSLKQKNLSGLLKIIKEIEGGTYIKDLVKTLKNQAEFELESILAPFSNVGKIQYPGYEYRDYMILENPLLPSLSDQYSRTKLSIIFRQASSSFEAIASKLSAPQKSRGWLRNMCLNFQSFMGQYFKNLELVSIEGENSLFPLKEADLIFQDPNTNNSQFSLSHLYRDTHVFVKEANCLRSLFQTMSEAKVDEVKSFLIYSYIQNFYFCLPFNQQIRILQARNERLEINPLDFVLPFIANELLDSYSKTQEYQKRMTVLKNLFEKLKETLTNRFENNAWLNEEGKKKVKAKLNNMEAVIIDKNIKTDERFVLPTHDYAYENNGEETQGLYSNCRLFQKAKILSIKSELSKKSGHPLIYASDPFMANAYNEVSANMIHIPPGYIFSKRYCEEEKMEELLSDFGFVIGHEMTHSFDKNGAMFNENGERMADWLGKENTKIFEKKNNQVARFYSTFEEAPGFNERGAIKVTEATADLGGFKIITDIAKTIAGFDYKKFFSLLAKLNYIHIDYLNYVYGVYSDPHPIGGGRINPLLMNSIEFQKEFNVKEGDYMHLPSEKFVTIW